MDHVAIMKKAWGMLDKIQSGEKTIESRWLVNKCVPWGRVKTGDTVYVKDSGEPVQLKATVTKVVSFTNLTPVKVKAILKQYGKRTGITPTDQPKYYQLFKDKNYCLLIFLVQPTKIKPFEIDKRGFGAMAAWLTVENIGIIRE